jgi:uncharacterized protein
LEGLCREVHEKTRAQVFFVTVKTLDGVAVTTFANELFAKWKIGEKKTDRGVLVLLATGDHKYWIEVGYGYEGILNDAKVGDIGRAMVPALKASNFDEAAKIEVRGVSKVIAADSGVTLAGLEEGRDTPVEASSQGGTPTPPDGIGRSSAGPIWPLVVFPIFFVGLFVLVIWGVVRNRARGIGSGGGYFPPGGTGSGGSSGGDGGGSSSGGGDSFSGGDGGSSGGGGAGGSW